MARLALESLIPGYVFVAAQAADLFTYHRDIEANPIVLSMGASAPGAKLLLMLGVVTVALIQPRSIVKYGLLSLGTIVGLIGAITNSISVT